MSVIILSSHFHSEQLLSNQLLQSLCALHFSLCVFHVMPFSPFFIFFTVVFLHLLSGSSNNIEIFRKELYKNNSFCTLKRGNHTHIYACVLAHTLFFCEWDLILATTVCYLSLTLKRIWFRSHRLAASVRVATS